MRNESCQGQQNICIKVIQTVKYDQNFQKIVNFETLVTMHGGN